MPFLDQGRQRRLPGSCWLQKAMYHSHVSQSLIRAVWHEWWRRKPEWKGWNGLWSSIKSIRCLWMCFSSGLDKIDRSEIGLKIFGSVRSLGLGSGITLAAFRAEGNINIHTYVMYSNWRNFKWIAGTNPVLAKFLQWCWDLIVTGSTSICRFKYGVS